MKKIIFFILIIVLVGGIIFFTKNKSLVKNQLSNGNIFQSTENNQVNLPTEQPVASGINLEILEPKANSIVNNQTIKIIGKTTPLAEVYINDKETKADSLGNFSLNYNLDEGENVLTIIANDENGNYAEKEIVITLQTLK
jgi:hypothetical protein